MNCDEVRALLGAFIDDELPVEVVARINAHVIDCLGCQDERTVLTLVRSRVHDYRQQLEPPAGFTETLKEKVEARLHAKRSVLKLRTPAYLIPIAAAAAVVLFFLPHRVEQSTQPHTVTATALQKIPLSAHELYSYEDDLKNFKIKPVEYDSRLATRLTGFTAQPPRFQGWTLVRTSIATVNSTKAIKYRYSQRGKIKTMTCYQFQGGIFDASELAHHVINGRSICCGTQNNVSLVYWRNANNDFVLASEMSRADLMSIALDS
jgi:hypothetical protein